MGTIVAYDALSPLRGLYGGYVLARGLTPPPMLWRPTGYIPHCGLRAAISQYISSAMRRVQGTGMRRGPLTQQ